MYDNSKNTPSLYPQKLSQAEVTDGKNKALKFTAQNIKLKKHKINHI